MLFDGVFGWGGDVLPPAELPVQRRGGKMLHLRGDFGNGRTARTQGTVQGFEGMDCCINVSLKTY